MKKILLLLLFTCSLLQAQVSFKHIATYNDNEFQNLRPGEFPLNSIINNPITNNNPNLILIVTPDYETVGPYFTGAINVYFYDNKWIINTPSITGIPENTKFNILAIPSGQNAYVHNSRASSNNYTVLDNPLLNGNPNAKFLITKASFRNTKEVGIAYAPSINRWTLLNLDLSLFEANAYNIYINENIFITTATTVSANNFSIDNPTTNNGTNNLIFITPLFQGVSNINPSGVWYNSNRWKIFNQNRVNMPLNSKFMVLSRGNIPYRNTDNEVHVFLNDITQTLCPKTLTQGDREFAGHGPRILTIVRLNLVNSGTQIEAEIDFTATETVSDFSQVKETFRRVVFTAPRGKRIAQILSPRETSIEFVSPSGGTQFIGANGNSGNTVTNTQPMNFINRMAIVGDTGGDDISTDNDCTDDTRIESISFFPIKVQYTY